MLVISGEIRDGEIAPGSASSATDPTKPAMAARRALSVAGESGWRRSWSHALLGAVSLCPVAWVGRKLEPIVDAGWFGLEDSFVGLRWLGTRWVAALAAALALTAVTGVSAIASKVLRSQAAWRWTWRYSIFLLSLYAVEVIHHLALIEVAGPGGSWILLDFLELLFAAALVALLWPLVFSVQPYLRPAASLFLGSGLFLFAALIWREPDALVVLLASLRLLEWPRCLVIGGALAGVLPYLAPVAALLWSATAGRRFAEGQPDES